MRQEELHHALLRHLLQRLAQLLRLHGVGELDAAQDLGREARHAAEHDVLALGQRVADAQRAVVRDADHVAGPGLVGDGAVLGEEELRRLEADRLAGAHQLRLHAARELARSRRRRKAMRSRWFGSMLAWILNTKPGHAVLVRLDLPLVRLLPARRRRMGGQASMRSRTPKFFSALPKKTGVRCPSRKASRSNGWQASRASATSSRQAPRSSAGRSAATRGSSGPRPASALVRVDAGGRGCGRGRRCRRSSCRGRSARSPARCRARASSRSRRGDRTDRALSRSILLMKVTIGMSRSRQTSNSLRVRASMPLAASITMTAESTAVSVR